MMVDVESFEKIELISDNFMNRDAETEDNLLAAPGLLEKLVTEAGKASLSDDWRAELDEL
ncbi:MAG: hypothetical protein GY795_43895 [Desulfobacterales bacterium]|nr:hypothetical protein [Desulfobacterales bacterium]